MGVFLSVKKMIWLGSKWNMVFHHYHQVGGLGGFRLDSRDFCSASYEPLRIPDQWEGFETYIHHPMTTGC